MPKITLNLNGVSRNLLLCFFVTALLCFSVADASAQIASPLIVAPSRQELTIDPGETAGVNIKFINQGETPVSGTLKVADFIVENKKGVPTLIEGPTQASPRFAASSWVTLPYDRIAIGAKDRVLINAKIKAPKDARAGGRYIAIYFEPGGIIPEKKGAPQEAATGVAARIASLVYLRVSGPVTEKALLTRFSAPRFLEYGPVKIETEILNRGDYHIRPRGVITVTDIFGRLIDQAVLEENNIFPDASRVYENELGGKWMFGRFKANLGVGYGERGKGLTGTLYFWVFPWRVTAVVVLALAIAILLFYNYQTKARIRLTTLEKKLEEEEEELKRLKEDLKKKESE